MASLNCFLAVSVRKRYYPTVRATPYQVYMLFCKIDVISVMNCFHELITFKINTGLFGCKMHLKLLAYYKLY